MLSGLLLRVHAITAQECCTLGMEKHHAIAGGLITGYGGKMQRSPHANQSSPALLHGFTRYPSEHSQPYINNLHTPKRIAAVPVHTPINHCNVLNLTASNRSLNAADSCSIRVSVSLIFKS